MQDAYAYAPLAIRNSAVPMAGIGSNSACTLFFLGLFFLRVHILVYAGIALFSAWFFPTGESAGGVQRQQPARAQLVQLGIINQDGLHYVNKVLSAAALTYVAATCRRL